MKAAVLREVGKPLSIETVSISKPGPREVLIRTEAAGVCHSDLHFIEGSYPHPLPAVLGHESAGRRRGGRLGSAHGEGGRPRDHLPVGLLRPLRGLPDRAHDPLHQPRDPPRQERGTAPVPRGPLRSGDTRMAQFLNLSSFAEQMLVHEHACVAIRKDMPLDRAALIGCSVMTGVGAVIHTSNVRPGETRGRDRLRRRGPGGGQRRGHRRRRPDHRHRHAWPPSWSWPRPSARPT